jgi:hypothetical protein
MIKLVGFLILLAFCLLEYIIYEFFRTGEYKE